MTHKGQLELALGKGDFQHVRWAHSKVLKVVPRHGRADLIVKLHKGDVRFSGDQTDLLEPRESREVKMRGGLALKIDEGRKKKKILLEEHLDHLLIRIVWEVFHEQNFVGGEGSLVWLK